MLLNQLRQHLPHLVPHLAPLLQTPGAWITRHIHRSYDYAISHKKPAFFTLVKKYTFEYLHDSKTRFRHRQSMMVINEPHTGLLIVLHCNSIAHLKANNTAL